MYTQHDEDALLTCSLHVKVPLLWVMKGSYLGLGVPNNRLTCMQGQKTLSLSYNIHLVLPYLLHDSQTIRFSKPLLFVMQKLVRLVSFSFHHACNV